MKKKSKLEMELQLLDQKALAKAAQETLKATIEAQIEEAKREEEARRQAHLDEIYKEFMKLVYKLNINHAAWRLSQVMQTEIKI